MEHTSLYHGTDARIVRMSDSQRAAYKKGCFLAVDYIWDVLRDEYEFHHLKHFRQPLGYDPKTSTWAHPWILLSKAMNNISGHKNDNPQYEYGSFYLTGLRDRAVCYARDSFAGGESGMNVYDVVTAMEIVRPPFWNPTGAVLEAIKTIKAFGNGPAAPVLFQFDDLDFDLLETDSGSNDPEAVSLMIEYGSVRYTGDIVLDLSKAEYLHLESR